MPTTVRGRAFRRADRRMRDGSSRRIAEFDLPAELEAAEPPEARGLRRDEVRLLVSDLERDAIEHARFGDLPRWLDAGDLLVVNTSGTLNAALAATAADGEAFELHLSTQLPGGFWTVEVRRAGADRVATVPSTPRAGTTLRLARRRRGHAARTVPAQSKRSSRPLGCGWRRCSVPTDVPAYLARSGSPIRYGYVKQPWPPSMYQTVFATEPGSAEMPSAGRPFTPELVTRLVSRRRPDRAAPAAHGRGQPGGSRAAVRRVLPRVGRHGRARQRRQARRSPRHRRGHDGRARARDRDRRPRHISR